MEQNFPVPFCVSQNGKASQILIVCEHASNYIPKTLKGLGLTKTEAESHIAWDPGASAVAHELCQVFDAVLVEGTVSRLVYDCNRPPEADSAIPQRSEVFDIPENQTLESSVREDRIAKVYRPFANALAAQILKHRETLRQIVTIHSFTPVFFGQPRDLDIGILHGQDPSFALRMMSIIPDGHRYDIRLNEPYSASDGVAHTLDVHGASNGLPSVMIEIRNDLVESIEQQRSMAHYLGGWIKNAFEDAPDCEAPE